MGITDDLLPAPGKVPVVPVGTEGTAQRGVRLDMLRLDLVDEMVSGNKWFKLIRNLQAAAGRHAAVLTFGGAWSNHLVATAAAAARSGFGSIGVVRGLHAAEHLTPTLQRCVELGMQLHFVSRADYAQRGDPAFLAALQQRYDHPFIVPEGGANREGREGAALIARYIDPGYTDICVSVGSGTTLAGLRMALPATQRITGFAPMKGGRYLEQQIAGWLPPARHQNWRIIDAYHFGGFGKMPELLEIFMREFHEHHSIPLDRVYTAKMMYGVLDLLQQDYFPPGAKILCIHTGGLQGNMEEGAR
jgi:1-aminocyclopropane-1-carboxylate deaminase